MPNANIQLEINAEQVIIGIRRMQQRVEMLEKCLAQARKAMIAISSHGHSDSYDWNADPKHLTRLEGDTFTQINRILGYEQTGSRVR